MQESDQPRAVGQDSNGSLYTPQLEHDSCGIGFIAQLEGPASHQLISDALTMLKNMEHRGACGCDPLTGDGAGILIQIPHLFFRKRCLEAGFSLPEAGQYGVGMVFFPQDESLRQQCREALNDWIDRMGFNLLGYREVPNRPQGIGMDARLAQPWTEQVFVQPDPRWDKETFERKLYLLRRAASMDLPKQITNLAGHFYFTSFSAQTIVYKGQLRTDQVESFFPDLEEDEVVSRIAVIHSRFSTNTFPNWRLAQPFRYIAHNGEINTIRGNVNWMRSKEAVMTSEVFSREELEMLFPICDIKQSDSCNLDSIVELLVMSGRSLPHVMMMLIPEAWQEHEQMDPVRRDFYEYHASLTEPWDGPAAVCFTDGNIVGATLDRNGLRPARYTLTHDGRLVLASETGALPIDPALVKEHGRLQPGKILVADLAQGRIVSDQELKDEIANRKPYGEWLTNNRIFLKDLPIRSDSFPPLEQEASLLERQHMFGVSSEELSVILDPMSRDGKEPIGSMGADTPLAILSRHSQHISHYVKQLFAQVSNPPIDPIRERLVMSLHTWIGSSQNALQERPESCEHIRLEQPVLTNDDLRRIRSIQDPSYQVQTLPIAYSRGSSLQNAVRTLCASAEQAIADDFNVLILSDRSANDSLVPIPALLAIGAVHHALIRAGKRGHTALILETAEAREVHHFATLIGFGAVAVNPYLAFDCLRARSNEEEPFFQKENNYIKAVNKGLLKVFSKMGISTLQSYHGAQIFEIVGINHAVVDECFTGTVSRLEGLGFEDIAREVEMRHQLAYPSRGEASDNLDVGGLYQWKRNGEKHLLNPKTIHLMQRASRQNDYDIYKQYAHLINEAVDQPVSIRNLFTFKEGKSIPLSEVEPVENILSRFATGAMSFGSISWEAHTTLAIAMNRIGGKSNSGEGGEDESRYTPLENGDSMRSATKQVASGRFGVTSYYLSQADELQIKMAQGAKPGEGGQLPGHKVDAWIAKVRHSTPGVGLISPPPHHDIYSIEDLAQLIFDLKNANRKARISVKLVSEAGVGTIAAGVAKAHADHILISGQDGGTGASPLSSIRHAGLPWELGLAEAHQTLVRNNLRSRVRLQADGQIRTGRDLAIATLLGAEEWGVATAALVAMGCIMMRKCHLNTCPVGIATQDEGLRKLFTGTPEDLVHFFTFLAEEMREIMAKLGFRTVDEMVGQADRLAIRPDLPHWKLNTLDLSPILYREEADARVGLFKQQEQDHGISDVLDWELIREAQDTLRDGLPTFKTFPLTSVNRAVGTMLSSQISKLYGKEGLPEGTLHFKFRGSAGQSFAAFGAPGIRFELVGEANDYFGKGLSGSQLIVYPDKRAHYRAADNMIIGNVAFYGATAGEAYIRGRAGERFCVRNSGITAVVEGIGDHGCEYMTGGTVVILGSTGRNFGAGMSGGTAYIFDPDHQFRQNCNTEQIIFDRFDIDDTQLLQSLIRRHYYFTGSEQALWMMHHWAEVKTSFVKVMPVEYKAILDQRKKERKLALIG